MDFPLVTVITPVYNSPFLDSTVRSVMTQDYPNIQYIIIDDGSEKFDVDAVSASAKEMNGLFEVIVMRNEINIGTVASLNKAIAVSSGKYIFNIAADDEFRDSSVISDWVCEFERTGALIVTALRDIYDPDMKVLLRTAPSRKIRQVILNSTPQGLYRAMYGSNYIVGCCTAQSRECIDRYGVFDEKYRFIEDYPRYLRLSREGAKIHLFERSVVKYRSGGISSQARFDRVYEDESDSIFRNEVLEYAEDKVEAQYAYDLWKKHTVLRHEFLMKYLERRFFGRMMSWFGYALKDPPMAAQFLQERVLIALHC